MEKAVEKCRPDLPPWWLKQVARHVAEHVHHQLADEGPRSQAPSHRTYRQYLIKGKSIKV
jgi:DNA-binding transcriptional regulator YdaS (Cro superfamily)